MRLSNFQQLQSEIRKKISLNLVDSFGASFVEALDQKQAKQVLGFALDLIRPYFQGLNLRVAALSAENIEINIPAKVLHQDEHLGVDEGVICSAALFAFRLLWKRNSPSEQMNLDLQKLEFERVRLAKGDLRLKIHFSKVTREAILAELVDKSESMIELTAMIFDQEDQLVAKTQLIASLKRPQALEWK